ncbi:ABC transporter permease [Modestobacter sp. VKM Ac-2979]|uniref:ABC transporter permease n=1 Tax=unclassified Modestobacter TaxID=2643866 RepID=UPI0022AB840C|nr:MULTISPECIES: ABC transporter permease [unclassified Modestobacter]MCZ2810292.1 ABC transporter permease [Modestobacter sp. VKM Ac-2979]MCZ2841778.1 ABC transporter permease [Modestobacter sp. VKM Ac-2980]
MSATSTTNAAPVRLRAGSAPGPDVVSLDPNRHVPGVRQPGFAQVLHAEWVKFWTVRSTRWSLGLLFLLGAGLTTLVCWAAATDLAAGDTGEAPAAFLTWGLLFSQLTALALGTLVVTSEYGTGMIRATVTAVPRRGRVVAAKAVVLAGVLFVAGVVTAVAGYFGGNWFLEREGVGMALSDDGVMRALLGNGLYLAGLGLFALATGLLIRHTAAAVTVGMALVLVVGNVAYALPGTWGEWVAKLMPGNAGGSVAQVAPFNGGAVLAPWTGFGVFVAEVAALMLVAVLVFRRRDA